MNFSFLANFHGLQCLVTKNARFSLLFAQTQESLAKTSAKLFLRTSYTQFTHTGFLFQLVRMIWLELFDYSHNKEFKRVCVCVCEFSV